MILRSFLSLILKQNPPDIDPISLEWLLLLKLVLLLLLWLSNDVATILSDDFSNISLSALQYNDPPSLRANSSPEKENYFILYIKVESKFKIFLRSTGLFISTRSFIHLNIRVRQLYIYETDWRTIAYSYRPISQGRYIKN